MGESPDKEELGGARAQTRAGAVDNEAADEDDALAQLKRFLSYLPPSVWEAPPVVARDRPGRPPRGGAALDRPARRRASPTRCAASSRRCSTAARCSSSARATARSLITALARLDGRPVGVLASDPNHYGGGLTADAVGEAHALRRPLRPVPPAGRELRRPARVRDRHRGRARGHDPARHARAVRRLPGDACRGCSVLVRKVLRRRGRGHGNAARLNLRYAWPSGDWGSLPIEGGLEAAYRRELEAAEDPVALRAEIEARLNAVRSPFRTAERFASRRSSTRATRGRSSATGRAAHELVAHEVAGAPCRRRGLRP